MSSTGLALSPFARVVLGLPKALAITAFLASLVGLGIASFSGADGSPSLTLYNDLLSSNSTRLAIYRTLWVASLVTFFSLIIAYPLALFISQARNRDLMLILVISPWLTSIVIRTFGWVVLLGNRGVINQAIMGLGLSSEPIQLIFTPFAMILGLVHVLLPFMVISILSVLMQVDRRLTEAGMSLGAGPIETFFRVTLPLSAPGALSGCALVYLISAGAIVTPLLLGGLRDRTIGTQIFQEIFALYDFPRAAALALILVVTSLIAIAPIQMLEAWLRGRISRI
ncbi:ABC transporter permease [Humitalea sp. 24SJ18S-53]|uniref:ABC transporter permease n=1 Tax=Humitalea sp. 24SJ18S-53 TaxID=3422307 RepID=UPI003D6653F3